ncbi:MAG: hypothetical protein AAGC74_01315 [Verrucomicrobiota bacterium]
MSTHQELPEDELQDLQRLLRLKNYERPADGYFEDFLDEFHRRQREGLMAERGKASWIEKFSSWISDLGAAKWAYGAGVAYAALMVGFFWVNQTSSPVELSRDQKEVLPGDRTLEHVELENPRQKSDGGDEILPRDF